MTRYGMSGDPVVYCVVPMDGRGSQVIVIQWEAIHSQKTMTTSATKDIRVPPVVNPICQLQMTYNPRYLQYFQRVLQGLFLLHLPLQSRDCLACLLEPTVQADDRHRHQPCSPN